MTDRARELAEREAKAGVSDIGFYHAFDQRIRRVKREVLKFVIGQKEANQVIVGYGAPAKGNTCSITVASGRISWTTRWI